MKMMESTVDRSKDQTTKVLQRLPALELGPRKTKRGIKISRRGIKSEPACSVKVARKSLTVPSFDTVRAVSAAVAVSI
jgi:hypothetical protein